jgi:hypothetical protein
MMTVRRRVETVIGPLSERFRIEKVWTRELWHLTNRLTRKFLVHSVGIYLNRFQDRNSLKLEQLVTA